MNLCLARCQFRLTLQVLCCETSFTALEVHARCVGMNEIVCLCHRHRFQHDAIDWAGWYAAFATRAVIGDDRMHQLVGADDRVDWTNLDAFGATDAIRFDDARERARLFDAVVRIQWNGCAIKQRSQLRDTRAATRRTLIDIRLAGDDRFRIRPATVVAALFALRLRQQGINAVGEQAHVQKGCNRSAYRRTGLHTLVCIEQKQVAAAVAGGKNHAFGQAEAHLARSEVGNEDHVATD